MAINFTKNVEQYTTINRGARVKQFTEYASKKQLENAGILSEEELNFAKSIKGTFSFALHQDGRYMAVTLYKANAERKYNFLILDLQEEAIAEVDSIKAAKAEILNLVQEAVAPEGTQEAEKSEDDEGSGDDDSEDDLPMQEQEDELAAAVRGLLDEALA